MKIELADFQQVAVDSMVRRLRRAQSEVMEHSSARQAICLAAPTGAGKTVIMSAVIEAMLKGDGFEFDDGPAVLWMTDSPELNEQSRQRLSVHIDSAWNDTIETIEESSFDEPSLPRGVWFLNTQKLGKTSLLVRSGDRRRHTFWETVAATITRRPGDLVLVVDEAHRGTTQTTAARNESNSIVQRFIMGHGSMPAVPLLVGVSATPQKFYDLLASLTPPPTHRPEIVPVDDVRRSGLLKQTIRLRHLASAQGAEHTLLEAALRQYTSFEEAWADEARPSGAERVKPVMLIQVEDGKKGLTSQTDLDAVIATVRSTLGASLQQREIAHAFQDSADVEAGGVRIRHLRPSEINNDDDVRVVLFKTALSTGWDCPRAEVMMSYRSARDETAIAQLVGRMVRAPLRREIPGSELLNGVDLYLPRFDEDALEQVVHRLRDDTSEERLASRTYIARDLSINPDLAGSIDEIREALAATPTFDPAPRRNRSDVKRLAEIAHRFERAASGAPPVLEDASERAREHLVARVAELHRECQQAEDFDLPQAAESVLNVTQRTRELAVDGGAADERSDGDEPDAVTESLAVSDRDLARRFDQLNDTVGNGVLRESLASLRASDHRADSRRMLQAELIAMFAEPDRGVDVALQEHARNLIVQWRHNHRQSVEALPDRERGSLEELLAEPGAAIVRQEDPTALPDVITVRKPSKNAPTFERHVYTKGVDRTVQLNLNGWESDAVEARLADDQVEGWLRNERTSGRWRLAVPYRVYEEDSLMYPDLLFFRRERGRIGVDVVDPHGLHLSDALAKLHGLARYAKAHCGSSPLSRVVVLAEVGGTPYERDLSNPEVAEVALRCSNSADVSAFYEYGETPPVSAPYASPSEQRDDVPRARRVFSPD